MRLRELCYDCIKVTPGEWASVMVRLICSSNTGIVRLVVRFFIIIAEGFVAGKGECFERLSTLCGSEPIPDGGSF